MKEAARCGGLLLMGDDGPITVVVDQSLKPSVLLIWNGPCGAGTTGPCPRGGGTEMVVVGGTCWIWESLNPPLTWSRSP